MTFQRGQSGNPSGRAKGKSTRRTQRVRKLIADKTGVLVTKVLAQAEAGDVAALQIFFRFLYPKQRFVAEPVDLPEVKGADEIQAQISRLASMAAAGVLDIDSMTAISKVLSMALGGRLEELEDVLQAKEEQAPDD